jgi:hypothetical protein
MARAGRASKRPSLVAGGQSLADVLLQGRPNWADELLADDRSGRDVSQAHTGRGACRGKASSGLRFVHVHAKFAYEHEEPSAPPSGQQDHPGLVATTAR